MLDLPGRQTLIAHLEFKVSHNGNEVGITAAFPHAIDRALYLHGTFTNSDQRVNDRTFRIVVRMNPKWMIERRFELSNYSFHFPRQCPTIGIAQYDCLCASTDCSS